MTNAKPSKSSRKREHLALQELGEKLIALKDSELDSIPLDDGLLDAIRDAARMKSHGALRRQKQLIGKLMTADDADRIRAALHEFGASERQSKRIFSLAERWRDRLITDSHNAMNEFEAENHVQDAELRQLLDELAATFDERTEKSLRRQIFRHVHAILVARTADG